MEVTTMLRVYEVDGIEPRVEDPPRLSFEVRSHQNRKDLVVLGLIGGVQCAVLATELEMAVYNATNVRR